jgi:Flp pilus assembly protein TadD
MTGLRPEFSGYNTKVWTVAFLIALLTIFVYLPALQNNFVNWDDDGYVYKNHHIQSIDFELFKWMFTTFRTSNWHPLTWLSHAIDYAIWGLNPMGYHLTSIIFHGLNTFLVVLLIIRLINYDRDKASITVENKNFSNNTPLIAGAVTGLLFGIHPIHVESVVWISERKDVLYAFFYLLSILSYLKYTSSPLKKQKILNYNLCLLLFILSLMSKPMAVTLPVVLIILDFYPLGRLHLKSAFTSQRKVVTEKLPFLILSLASSVITIIAQQVGGSVVPLWTHPFEDRLWIAIKALCFYLFKIVWPTDLVPLYPFPIHLSLNFEYIGSLFLIIIISIFYIWLWHMRQRFWLAIWAYYIITLFPVLGLIQVGGHAAADRYMYLPSIGPFLLFGIGISWVWEKIYIRDTNSIIKKMFIFTPLIILLCFLSILTVRQEAIWKDSISLWDAELSQFPKLHVIYNNRAEAYMETGNYQKAIKDYEKSISINPRDAAPYNRLGVIYEKLGNYLQAIENYSKSLDLTPKLGQVNHNRNVIYQKILEIFEKNIRQNPRNAVLYIDRGTVHAMMKNYQKALEDYATAIKLNPQIPAIYYNRGLIFTNLDKYQQALVDFATVIKLNPRDAEAYYNRGFTYEKLGDHQQAIKDFQTAARLGDKDAQDYLQSRGIVW